MFDNIEEKETNNKSFDARCAEAVAANNITDKLKEESAQLLIADLRANPDSRISCMCGQCTNLTAGELADNLEAKGSEYEEWTNGLIGGTAMAYKREESKRPDHLQTLQKKST